MFPVQGFAFWQKFTLDLQRALSTVETNNLSWYLFFNCTIVLGANVYFAFVYYKIDIGGFCPF